MIVSEKMAQECWDILRMWARLVDEKWDADELARAKGRSESEIKQAFHAAARSAHPDMGGDAAKFALVDRAKEAMLVFAKRQAPAQEEVPHGGVVTCPRCNGARTIALQRGFKQMRVQCPTCRGNGEITEGERPDIGGDL